MRKNLQFLCAAAAALAVSGVAVAVPVINPDINTTGYTVSNSDLLQTELSATAITPGSNFAKEGGGVVGEPGLHDGLFGNLGDAGTGSDQATAGAGDEVTYTLDTSTNTLGYKITNINTFAGWSYGRYSQGYDVSFHLVGAPSGVFTAPITVYYSPSVGDTQNYNTRVEISDSTGTIATGVDEVKFTFADTSTPVVGGYNGYRELDVIGSAVPEPASLSLVSLAALGLLRRRRMA